MENNKKEFEIKSLINENKSFINTLPVMVYFNPDMKKKINYKRK